MLDLCRTAARQHCSHAGVELTYVLGLHASGNRSASPSHPSTRAPSRPALPPSTSSPMIKHAAVWICLLARSAAVVPVVPVAIVFAIVLRRLAAEAWATLGSGRERWRATWDSRENMEPVVNKSSAGAGSVLIFGGFNDGMTRNLEQDPFKLSQPQPEPGSGTLVVHIHPTFVWGRDPSAGLRMRGNCQSFKPPTIIPTLTWPDLT